MNEKVALKDFKIKKEEYIYLKKIAYDYYERFSKLDNQSRRLMIESIKKNNYYSKIKFAEQIIINTLLIPDTKDLLQVKPSSLLMLKNKVNNQFNEQASWVLKMLELQQCHTKELVEVGTLKYMEPLTYKAGVLSDSEYVSIREYGYEHIDEFNSMSINNRVRLIDIIDRDIDDLLKKKIYLSAFFIPDDKRFLLEYKKSNYEMQVVANKYKLPVEMLFFKMNEIYKQDVMYLISNKKIVDYHNNDSYWYRNYGKNASIFIGLSNNNEVCIDLANKKLAEIFNSSRKE